MHAYLQVVAPRVSLKDLRPLSCGWCTAMREAITLTLEKLPSSSLILGGADLLHCTMQFNGCISYRLLC